MADNDSQRYVKNGPNFDNPICQECLKEERNHYVKCRGIIDPEKFIPPGLATSLDEDQLLELKAAYDPVTWANLYLGWSPRSSREYHFYDRDSNIPDIHIEAGIEYQKTMLNCSAYRTMYRVGRRAGKTDALCVFTLYKLVTNSDYKVLFIAPQKSHVDNFFERFDKLIESSDRISADVVRNVSSPHKRIEFSNGSRIVGFTSGSSSGSQATNVRGQSADLIVIDEWDYLNPEDMKAIRAILMTTPDTILKGASTPSGRRDLFYVECNTIGHKEFHYPSQVLPFWNDDMEREMRSMYTANEYRQEILAEWGFDNVGVFQKEHVDKCLLDYSYEDIKPESKFLYGIGVDWNDDKIGTQIYVIGYSTEDCLFYGAAKYNVAKAGWTQALAIKKIIELNRIWNPVFIYVDEGYGATQIQLLRQYSYEKIGKVSPSDPDVKLKDIVKGINFSSKVDVRDPITRQPDRKDMKQFLVQNAVRRVEDATVRIPSTDKELIGQLLNYIILRRSATGKPIYSPNSTKIGDHLLDAFMLALLGFTLEYGDLIKTKAVSTVSFVNTGDSTREDLIQKRYPEERSVDRTNYFAIGRTGTGKVTRDNIWKWPGFLRDEPLPRPNRMFLGRGRRNHINRRSVW